MRWACLQWVHDCVEVSNKLLSATFSASRSAVLVLLLLISSALT